MTEPTTTPDPSPSIAAAAREIVRHVMSRRNFKFNRAGQATPPLAPEIADILTQHFAQAIQAERAWEIYREYRRVWGLDVYGDDLWCVVSFRTGDGEVETLVSGVPDPATAILLAAAGEKG